MEGSDLTIHKLRESLTETQIAQFIASLSEQEAMALMYDWRFWARPNQILPDWAWRFALALCGRGFGKMLCNSTPCITTSGWKRHGDLGVGDKVFDENGVPCNVTGFYPQPRLKCYRLHFSDSTHVDAGAEHYWRVWGHKDRKQYLRQDKSDSTKRTFPPANWAGFRESSAKSEWGVNYLTTEQLINNFTHSSRNDANWCIPTTQPLQMSEVPLPVEPYLAGLWVGDGGRGTGSFTTHSNDAVYYEKAIVEGGYRVGVNKSDPSKEYAWVLSALDGFCKDINTSFPDKNIPDIYLHNSMENRLAFLQGLMDSDGHSRKSTVEFCSMRKDHAEAVMWLARSLGQKPVLVAGEAKLNGKSYGTRYRVHWKPNSELTNPFRIPRKKGALQFDCAQQSRNNHRMVVDWEDLGERDGYSCISVDSPNRLYLAGEALIPTSNTRMGAEWIIERAKAGKGPISLVGQTSADVRDVMVEAGPSSIMMCSPPDFMPLYEPSKRRLTWPNGVTATTFSGDEPGQLRGPQSQCLVAGTKVIVDGKERNIETLSVGTEVLTRFGYFEVEAVRNYQSEVGSVKFSNGRELRGTFNHPVWSLDRSDWVWMKNLRENETVTSGMSQKMVTSVAGLIEKQLSSTDGCGPILMDQFQKGLSFTIRMGTDRITVLPTWKLFQTQITQNCTLEMAIRELLTEPMSKNVFLVDENTLLRKITGQGSAKNVAPEKLKREGKRFGHVVTVGKNFCLVSETSVANVVSTWGGVGSETVYSLQVAGLREYIANDIVVHNTVWIDELPKFDDPQEAFDQVSFGLRIGDARCLITTTPTPHKIIKELYTDAINQKTLKSGAKRVHLITGSTMDNSDNLDPDALEDMVAKYEGTRLGEQELHGKILWEAENALWKQSDIDRDRVVESQVPHFRMSCIGVDPTVGDPGKTVIDECGIMTGGLGYDGHGYLTGDYTFKGTPAQWAGKIAALLNNGAFDFVVAEKNNGGLLVTETLKSYGVPEARIILVHASQGKLTRAEPISLLSEQGKIHHVGEYVQLEQELVCYEGKGKSPNRLDAFVWLFTFLLLGKENREVSVRTKRF